MLCPIYLKYTILSGKRQDIFIQIILFAVALHGFLKNLPHVGVTMMSDNRRK